jgi:hypothetical protein
MTKKFALTHLDKIQCSGLAQALQQIGYKNEEFSLFIPKRFASGFSKNSSLNPER